MAGRVEGAVVHRSESVYDHLANATFPFDDAVMDEALGHESEEHVRRMVFLALAAVLLALMLASCAGSSQGASGILGALGLQKGEPELSGDPICDTESFDLNGWHVEIKSSELVFDKGCGKNDLIVHMSAKNETGADAAFSNGIDLNASQGDVRLGMANAMDDSGKFLVDLEPLNRVLASDDSVDFTYGWELVTYDQPVNVVFSDYVSVGEAATLSFDVSTCARPGAEDGSDGAKGDGMASLVMSAQIDGAAVWAVKPWHVSSATADTIMLMQDGNSQTLTVRSSDARGSAQKWAQSVHDQYGSASEIEQVTVGNTTYYCFYPADSQFQLFADAGESGRAINICGMLTTLESSREQIESIAVG